MTSQGKYRTETNDLVAEVADLRRRLLALETNPRIGNTTIDRGTLTVKQGKIVIQNELGIDMIRMGLLSDGEYDVEAFDPSTGAVVRLSQLAFGATAGVVTTRESTTNSSYNNLATVGPTVTSDIGTSGRCIVMLSMFLEAQAPAGSSVDTGAAYMTFDVSGPTSSTGGDGRAATIFFKYDKTGPVEDTTYDIQMGATRVAMLTGLAAGSYTFTAKYKSINSHTVFFSDRVLAVVPY